MTRSAFPPVPTRSRNGLHPTSSVTRSAFPPLGGERVAGTGAMVRKEIEIQSTRSGSVLVTKKETNE